MFLHQNPSLPRVRRRRTRLSKPIPLNLATAALHRLIRYQENDSIRKFIVRPRPPLLLWTEAIPPRFRQSANPPINANASHKPALLNSYVSSCSWHGLLALSGERQHRKAGRKQSPQELPSSEKHHSTQEAAAPIATLRFCQLPLPSAWAGLVDGPAVRQFVNGGVEG